jgi:hypothetical protein
LESLNKFADEKETFPQRLKPYYQALAAWMNPSPEAKAGFSEAYLDWNTQNLPQILRLRFAQDDSFLGDDRKPSANGPSQIHNFSTCPRWLYVHAASNHRCAEVECSAMNF